MLNPIESSSQIKNEFINYISTRLHIADREYANMFLNELREDGNIAKGPYLDISDSFETGSSINELINDGEMSSLFEELEAGTKEEEKEIKLKRPLYRHQEMSVRKVNQDRNLVVTTGTGSGKTECFLLPILNFLLKEKEADKLSNGVRAILIYPMNALANDQMKRLRAILANYRDITFGVYNSSTKQNDDDAIRAYGQIYRDENNNPQEPLPNEVISRKQMQDTPPHILVTNYAMLEYMLLRPNDDKVFSGAKLKFIVLDEAHTYRGAKGMETALLLRRLKARISSNKNVLHILTSATLGGKESDGKIVEFAKTLCDADFKQEDIIRSHTVMPSFPSKLEDYSLEMFSELARQEFLPETVLKKYKVEYDSTLTDQEILFDLCLKSRLYKILRECATSPISVSELTAKINEHASVKENDIVNLITVASRAVKNKMALIKARYHMFFRALEGAYITLGRHKNLYLRRMKSLENGYKIFEAVVCDDCGRIGIVGKNISGHLEFANNRWATDKEMYLLHEVGDVWDEEDEEESSIEKTDFIVCAKCGKILHESQEGEFDCECGTENHIHVRKSEKRGNSNDFACPCCHSGTLRTFYLGYDAATAVLGTALYEQLPAVEIRPLPRKQETEKPNGLFGKIIKKKEAEFNKKPIARQFLSFSDSRSEAAYFACYMNTFYEDFLRRRGIWHVVNANLDAIRKDPWEIKDIVDELESLFETRRSFADAEDDGRENLKNSSRRQAWVAVINEMVNARRSTSLTSLGMLGFAYKGFTKDIAESVAKALGDSVSADEIYALFQSLVMDILYHGAIDSDKISLNDDQKEYIFYTTQSKRTVKSRYDSQHNKSILMSWLPSIRANGSYYTNNRIKRLMKVLDVDENTAAQYLGDFWDNVLMGSLKSTDGNGYYLPIESFQVIAGNDDDMPVYICEKCGRTTLLNCKGKCSYVKCDGNLRKISRQELLENNHYANLYSSEQMQPLHIKEHTAQLGREEQQHYQELFINKKINALSCSTTFEMGVDVGDLETVFLRDMPPAPDNYVQRAGRAGRSINSAAYALTYAKLSSHDFTYYDKPERMIAGKIGVPMFSISNEKIVKRHIYAVALSSFFAENEDVYNGNDADVLLNGNGYERLVEFLNSCPEHLKGVLKESIPGNLHDSLGINEWKWVDDLIGTDGVLAVAVQDFRTLVAWYNKEMLRAYESQDSKASDYGWRLRNYRRNRNDKCGKNELIEFLVRNNVLPKYGFPVDTVELHQGMASEGQKKLQLVRDLQLAIAEYAPDAQVVADGKLYTSRYIRKLPNSTGQVWEDVYIAKCKDASCATWNYLRREPGDDEKCISCGSIIEHSYWKKAIEPRKGFIAEQPPADVPMRKPDRSFRSDDYYIGDPQRQNMDKRSFLVNDEYKLQIESSANDSLMVVCQDMFHVCDQCGYAISPISGAHIKDYKSNAFKVKEKHKSPWGKDCNGVLTRKKLCHVFKTDVVKITFCTSLAKNTDTMLSVVYALLEAVSEVLEIERTDIKGCLHKVRYKNALINSIVLYDAVAGGAGHVRRLFTEDCNILQHVIEKAIDLTSNCNCSPSCYNCLRNYYNQAVHDMLDRHKAANFLKAFHGTVVPET